jgi:hypothetical protein
LCQRREVKKIAKSRPAEHGLPFSTRSLSKLVEFLVAEGVVDDISHEGLRRLLREESVTFQRLNTSETSTDPDYAVKKARVEHLYAIADPEVVPEPGEPEVIFRRDLYIPAGSLRGRRPEGMLEDLFGWPSVSIDGWAPQSRLARRGGFGVLTASGGRPRPERFRHRRRFRRQ